MVYKNVEECLENFEYGGNESGSIRNTKGDIDMKIINKDGMMKSRENEKFQILPEGPPRMKKRRRVLRTIFFCAAARRQPQKVRHRRQERARMLKNLKI